MYHFSSTDGLTPLTFRHFGRKGYSLFAALGREVKVGVLSVATLTTAAPALASAGGSTVNDAVAAEADTLRAATIDLDEATAVASRAPIAAAVAARTVMTFSRDDIAAAGVTSINDIIKLCAGIDVRQRGAFGVQTDISVDGGTFDQVTILLNGVNISSPHTGHLSADFPVTAQDIERIEVLEGPAARVFGTSAFTGAINIVTRTEQREVAVHGYGGMYAYGGAEARLSVPLSWGGNADGATSSRDHAIFNHLSGGYTRSDGATPNSQFASSRAFWQGQLATPGVALDYQVGYSYKPYGANTFYGAASTDQWESNERWMGALRAQMRAGNVHLVPSVSWNRWYDHYQWHRDNPAGENFHQVDVYALGLNSWTDWPRCMTPLGAYVTQRTSLGVETRGEGIRSTKLGEPLEESQWTPVHRGPADDVIEGAADVFYRFAAWRTNVSAFLEHTAVINRWTFSAGVLANTNSALDTRWRFYPGIDIAFRPSRQRANRVGQWRLFASWNMALRMPTFTDLYYSGTGIEGTRNLSPERTQDVSFKVAYAHPAVTFDASPFYSHKTDMIDWVVTGDDGIFRSGNFSLDNLGLRLDAAWLPRQLWGERFPLRKVGVQYCYIDEDITYPATVLASKYAMEYVRHKLVATADATLCSFPAMARQSRSRLNLSMTYRYCDRTSADSYGLLDARLSWDAPHISIYADARNVLDATYYDFGYIRQPGFWIIGGLRITM